MKRFQRIRFWMLLFLLVFSLSACAVLPSSEAPAVEAAGDTPAGTDGTEDTSPADSSTHAEGVDEIATENPESAFSIPVLTEVHQGITYAPGQLVIVFAEGFDAGERLSVSAMHESAGMVKSAQAEANSLGQLMIYHWVQESPEAEGAYPDGAITFWVTGESGIVKNYAFALDYNSAPQTAGSSGCGAYPPEPVLGGSFVAWCAGLTPDQTYQTNFSIQSNGNTLLEGEDARLAADGVGFLTLSTESGDPAGVWTITIGGQPFDINVISNQ
jgi:hypothetical protein